MSISLGIHHNMNSSQSYECPNSLSMSMSSNSSTESKTNLIINYLPQTMSGDDLKVIFQSVGPIESCKLINDKLSQQSLCFGFVNYTSIEDAEKAIKSLNGLRIENKVIKVSYARPSCESIKGANLYICGLPKNWGLDELNSYFGQCGRIITSRILFNPNNGLSKGVGFIRFDQRHEADLAIQKLNGSLPESGAQEPVTVKFANYPLELKNKMLNSIPFVNCDYFKIAPSAPLAPFRATLAPTTPIFNPRYSFYTTNDILACNSDNLFQAAGLFNQSSLLQQQQQQQAQQVTQPNVIHQQPIHPTTPNGGWCLFVYNLCPEIEENALWHLFGPFGAVQSVKIIRDFHTQKCKGFGFVTMSSYENAMIAVNSLNGILLSNRVLQVSFKSNFRN